MKNFYSVKSILLGTAMAFASVAAFAQTKTITITNTSIGGPAVLGSSYDSGAEKNWIQNNVNFAGKAIMSNGNNQPANSAPATLIQTQANNGVIYNTTPLPGRLVSIKLTYAGNANLSSLSGGSATRLVNNTAGNYAVTDGTAVGAASSTGWSEEELAGTNYTYFAIKRGTGASYLSSIVIEYKDSGCPTITTQPKDVTVAPDAEASFSVVAQGYLLGEQINYQWEQSTDGGTTFTSIIGAMNDATYKIVKAVEASPSIQYRVIVSNESCSIISSAATLTVDKTLAVDNVSTAKKLVVNTNVTNELMFGTKASVTIFNMNGQVVKSADVSEGTRLNVANLTKGMYIVSAVVNGKAVSQKIIKK